MAISPDPTVPNVIYLDEQAVSDALSYMGRGTISEIVERSLTEDESTKEGGLNKVLVGRFASRDMDASETEIVRHLDPIGKLAMLQEALSEEDLLQKPDTDFSMDERDSLQTGQLLEIECILRQTPIESLEEFANRFSQFQNTFGSLIGMSKEDTQQVEEAQSLLSALNREGDIMRAVLGGDAACDFVFTYNSGNFRNKPLNFPRQHDTYTVLCQLTTKFDENESISLINFVDMAEKVEENPRKRKRKIANMKRQFTEAASDITGRNVSSDEFEIAHPDVQAKIFAIYQ